MRRAQLQVEVDQCRFSCDEQEIVGLGWGDQQPVQRVPVVQFGAAGDVVGRTGGESRLLVSTLS